MKDESSSSTRGLFSHPQFLKRRCLPRSKFTAGRLSSSFLLPPSSLFLCLAFTLLLAASQTQAQQDPAGPRPKIGLALSGGSATGLAQIGGLEWFETQRIPVDYVSGTSMG